MTCSVPSDLAAWPAPASPAGFEVELDGHGSAGHLLSLEISGDSEVVAGIGPRGGHKIGDTHARRASVRSDADGEDGDFGVVGRQHRRLGIDAGILASIAEDDDTGHRGAAFFVNQIAQGLAEPGLDPLRPERFFPIGRIALNGGGSVVIGAVAAGSRLRRAGRRGIGRRGSVPEPMAAIWRVLPDD